MRLIQFIFFIPLSLFGFNRSNVAKYSPDAEIVIPMSYPKRCKIHMAPLEEDFLHFLKKTFNIEAFVESGTYEGESTTVAGNVFARVHSIELAPTLFEAAREKFKEQSHIHIHWGSSHEIIPKLLPDLPDRTLFYLDGHWSEGYTAKGDTITPILHELDEIAKQGKDQSYIIIDDIRLFQGTAYPDRVKGTCADEFPDLDTLLQALTKINPSYQICILGDELFAYPEDPKVCVSPVLEAVLVSKLSDTGLFSDEEIEKAEKEIMYAKGKEKQAFFEFYDCYHHQEDYYGWKGYSGFWYGLTLFGEGEKEQASQIWTSATKDQEAWWRMHDYTTQPR